MASARTGAGCTLLFIVLLVIGYHHACAVMLRKIATTVDALAHVWFRWFNEVPSHER